jgi:type I restriction enzyme, S subunit
VPNVKKIFIPIPPLPIQQEIVNILDKFTQMEAELEARTRQYEYYRNELLNFEGKEIEWKTLNKISSNFDSKRKPVTRSDRESGKYPYYGASGIVDYVNDYIFDGDYLLVSEDGANLTARNTPIAFSISDKSWVNNHAHVLKFEKYATRRIVEIYLNSIDLIKYISGAAQPKLNQENLNKIPIPIPPLAEQNRIVSILDKFDKLVNDISGGLPAEIQARRKQYEYYRGKLLSFKSLNIE